MPMKLFRFTMVGPVALLMVLGTTSCNKEGCTNENALNYDSEAKKDDGSCELEYIADDQTFANWSSWTQGAQHTGADPSLGGAHGGNDSSAVRTVYWKESQTPVDGIYPLGTVIIKQTELSDGSTVLTGMVKRGDKYDASGGDWDYFMLNSDGTIADDGAARGSDLMNGMCKSCHAFADTDFIFTD